MSTLQPTPRPIWTDLSLSSRPLLMSGILALSDLMALMTSCVASVCLRLAFNNQYDPTTYWRLWPILFLFLIVYATTGLYPAVCLSPVDELRQISLSTTLLYLTLGAAIFLFGEGNTYSRSILLMAWILSLITVLFGRFLTRQLFTRYDWWGYPVLILGAGKTGSLVVQTLQHHPSFGLKPLAVLDDDPNRRGDLHGVPVIGPLTLVPLIAQERDIHYAIVAMPGLTRDRLLRILEKYGQIFPHLLTIPDLFGFASLWVGTKDLGGILGLEVRQRLLLPGPCLTKTILDKVLTILLGALILPLLLLIAVIVKLDSQGPVFCGHSRLGLQGCHFTAWKFRSMFQNAEEILEAYLKKYPSLRAGWEQERQLNPDPRLTRVGRLLRYTSLDELPQLWNVLRGEMSLVGPRPIINEEVILYADKYSLYTKVLPGLTGLWQVSGRNKVSYEERVNLDAYYVRNWSIWLDLYILIRSVWLVFAGNVAY